MAQLLGLEYPIVQGAFGGGLSTPQLVAAVSNSGGLGSFGAHHLAPEQILEVAAQIRQRTTKPFALNLWIPLPGEQNASLSAEEFQTNLARLRPYYAALDVAEPAMPTRYSQNFEAQIEAVLEAQPTVFSFVFGCPAKEIIKEMRQRKILTIGAASTVEEAIVLEEGGVDIIVASGSDAGGHRPAFLKPVNQSLVGTFSLVPQIADAVKAPVIAAGGIGDGRGIAAAFTLGAEGVQLGTSFLACHESGASEAHKAQLVSAAARTTVLTRVFSGRYARGIHNQFMEEMEQYANELPTYPIQNWFTQPLRKAAGASGKAEFLALWAGQAAALSRRQSAGECFANLVAQTNKILD